MNLYETLNNISNSVTSDYIIGDNTISSINGSWMESIFGFSDGGGDINIFYNLKSNLEKSRAIKKILAESAIYNPETGKLVTPVATYNAGWFISPTINEIRDLIKILNLTEGSPNVAVVQGKDVGIAQLESNPYEIFQGASQFNALEMIDVDRTPYDGIESYINDQTQGPRTALACAPGTFVRNYWLTNEYQGQFNALEKLDISHLNGYLIWGTKPNDILNKLQGDVINDIMIPCMIYTQLAGVTNDNGQMNKHISSKRIHQIYSSGVPINRYRNGGDESIQLEVAKRIIKAEYVGAIGMGLILHHYDSLSGRSYQQRPRINLTLIGGGVFGVSINIIINAIIDAMNEFGKYSFDVYVHAYNNAHEISTKLSAPIVPFGTDLSDTVYNATPHLQQTLHQTPKFQERLPDFSPTTLMSPQINYNDYLLVVPSENKLDVYSLRSYQKELLDVILNSKMNSFPYRIKSNYGDVFVNLFRARDDKNNIQIGFIAEDGGPRYFVKNNQFPIGKAVEISSGVWQLYHRNGNKIWQWPSE